MPLVLLVATLILLALYARGDVAEFLRFVRLDRSSDRRRRYGVWIVKQVLVFALPGSPRAAQQCMDMLQPLLAHALAMLAGRPHP